MDNVNPPTCSDINSLFKTLEEGPELSTGHDDVIKKLHAIRLWQLMQQEELKKQQQTQLALLKARNVVHENEIDKSDGEKLDVNEEESVDEALAYPLVDDDEEAQDIGSCASYHEEHNPTNLETILEQTSVIETSDESDRGLSGDNDDVKPNLQNYCDEAISKNVCNEDECFSNLANCDINVKEPVPVNVESSFEKVSLEKIISFDEVPLKGTNKKTFEQIIEEQLNTSKDKPKYVSSVSTPKRSFLKKGQGIARFKGPPIKPKPRQKPVASNATNLTTDKRLPLASSEFNNKQSHENLGIFNRKECSAEIEKPRIRKTARKKEPIKELKLKPVGAQLLTLQNLSPVPHGIPQRSDFVQDKYHVGELGVLNGSDNDDTLVDSVKVDLDESVWSDVDESILTLNTTGVLNMGPLDFDKTSNETFEQMERFCNQRYGTEGKCPHPDPQVNQPPVDDQSLPAPSKLMQKLFPSIRPPPKVESPKVVGAFEAEPLEENQNFEEESEKSTEPCEAQPPKLLKTKLEEMEKEIKKFQSESAKLSIVRLQEEEQLCLLKKEFEEFQKQKEDELKRLDEFKKAESKKLKKDKKLFEDHVTALKAIPNKKDRDYINELEKNICELQQDSKVKEQRLIAANNRLRTQLDNAYEENNKLKEKLKSMEDKLAKFEKEERVKKSKKSNAVWNAINTIVDETSVDENDVNVERVQQVTRPIAKKQTTTKAGKKRQPLVDKNDNHLVKSDSVIVEKDTVHDSGHEIAYSNGTKKVISADGSNSQIKFANGDVKTVSEDGTMTYYYVSSGTKHITHTNGMQVIEFSNKQVERHFPDGSKHISFNDGSSKMMKLDGTEETIFPDGTIMVVKPNGHKTIEFSNGQREIHTPEYKRREYPEGTCKTVYADGRQETKYASGRLRIKDASGTLIVDRMTDPINAET